MQFVGEGRVCLRQFPSNLGTANGGDAWIAGSKSRIDWFRGDIAELLCFGNTNRCGPFADDTISIDLAITRDDPRFLDDGMTSGTSDKS